MRKSIRRQEVIKLESGQAVTKGDIFDRRGKLLELAAEEGMLADLLAIMDTPKGLSMVNVLCGISAALHKGWDPAPADLREEAGT